MNRVDSETRVAAAGVLARAFIDDPGYIWIEPDRERRARYLAFVYERLIVPLSRLGETWSLPVDDAQPGAVCGVAGWWPPGRSLGLMSMLGAGLAALPLRVGVRTTWRTLIGLLALGRAHAAATRGVRHWFLDHLAVDPAAQGLGLGRKLVLRHFEGRARGDGLPAFLHTSRDTNVPFYQSLGFAVVDERRVGGASGFVLWTMKR